MMSVYQWGTALAESKTSVLIPATRTLEAVILQFVMSSWRHSWVYISAQAHALLCKAVPLYIVMNLYIVTTAASQATGSVILTSHAQLLGELSALAREVGRLC